MTITRRQLHVGSAAPVDGRVMITRRQPQVRAGVDAEPPAGRSRAASWTGAPPPRGPARDDRRRLQLRADLAAETLA